MVGGGFRLKMCFLAGRVYILMLILMKMCVGETKAPQGKIFWGIFYLFAGFSHFFQRLGRKFAHFSVGELDFLTST